MQSHTNIKYSVVMGVCDDLHYITRTMHRIRAAVENRREAELIVVDNGSEDGSYEWLRKNYSDIARILRLPVGSISEVRNYGASHARGEVLCFVDADCVVQTDHLERVGRALRKSSAAAVGARYELPQKAGWVETAWHKLHRTGERAFVNFLSAGNFSIRTKVFRKVGGFAEGLVTGEDAELCKRLRQAGYRIYQDPAIKVIHLGNAKTLPQFFRKQLWYALGMFGTVDRQGLDKPTVGMIVHLVLILLGTISVLSFNPSYGTGIVYLSSSALIVPASAVVYRWKELGCAVQPIRSLILYEIFFAARVAAIVLLLSGRIDGWRPK